MSLASKSALALIVSVSTLQAATIEQRVLDLEIDNMLNKISFSGELRTQGTYYNSSNTVDGHTTKDKIFHGGVDLYANAKPTNRVSVYTTFQASYAYGKDLNIPSVETQSRPLYTPDRFTWLNRV